MTLRVAINGFGRIGRNVMRGWISRGADTGIEIVGVNATSDPKTSAHLLTYDSILGKLDPSVKIETTDDSMIVNGKEVKFFSDRNPLNCPWKEWVLIWCSSPPVSSTPMRRPACTSRPVPRR